MSFVLKTLPLCLAIILAQVPCNINGLSGCPCLKTLNRDLRSENIESYMIQKAGICRIDAVLFKTARGHIVCSDPKSIWAKHAMHVVDEIEAFEKTACLINSTSTNITGLTQNKTSDLDGQHQLRTTTPKLFQFDKVNATTGRSFCPCLNTSETVLCKHDIKSYKKYEADICHIDAIEFKTVNGSTFCFKPQKHWVKRAMKFVDQKANKTTVNPMNSTSTFNTTSHWNGQNDSLVKMCLHV